MNNENKNLHTNSRENSNASRDGKSTYSRENADRGNRNNKDGFGDRRSSFHREGSDRRSNSSAPQARSFGSFEDKPWRKNTEDTRSSDRRPSFNREGGDRRPSFNREGGDRRPSFNREGGDRRPSFNREGGDRRPSFNREGGDRRPSFNREGGDRRPSFNREGGDRRPSFNREGGDRRPSFNREGGDRRPSFNREGGDRRPSFNREGGDRRPSFNREGGDRRPSFNREGGDRRSNSSAPQTRSFGSFEDKPWKKNTEDTRSSDRRPSFNREGGAGRPKSFGSEDKPWRKNTEDTRSSDRRPSFNREGGAGRPKSFGSEDKPWRKNTEGARSSDRRPSFNREGGAGRPKSFSSEEKPWRKNTEGAKSFDRRPSFNREGGAPRYRDSRQRTDDYNPNAKYSVKKQIQYKELNFDPEAPIRLNKYLANAGICSRREADEFISAGVVSVNGEIKSELGTKVKRSDIVKFHDDPVKVERKVYLILNKPKNCVTTSDDPQERNTVMDIVRNACPERIYPVGRLDRNTTGVLILTNDGELASKLTHPKFLKKKIYHVHLDQKVSRADLDKLVSGVQLEDGDVFADAASYVSETERSEVGLEIHSGKNRIVRRMFESLGYKVIKLDRVYFAGMTKKNLKRGDWRFLTEEEVNFLRMGSYE